MKKNAKIYVAGNTGLVGSSILKNLKKNGYHNFVFTPFPEYDLRNQETTESFFKKEKPEYVFLSAAKVGGILANNTYPAEFIYDNLMIATNIIHASFKNKVKKLLFLGSSCIYPKLCPQPIKEEYLLTGSLEPTNEAYALAKISGLKMCEFYRKQYRCDFISAMPTNLYGYGDNFNLETSHVMPAIIRKMHLAKCLELSDFDKIRKDLSHYRYSTKDCYSNNMNNNDIEKLLSSFGINKTSFGSTSLSLWGSGSPKREFLFSDDLTDALIYLMNNYSDFEHVNIGTGNDITIKNLAEKIKSIVGFTGKLLWNTSKPDGTPQKLLDVTKLHNLGWKEQVSLDSGIKKLYDWYLSNIKGIY